MRGDLGPLASAHAVSELLDVLPLVREHIQPRRRCGTRRFEPLRWHRNAWPDRRREAFEERLTARCVQRDIDAERLHDVVHERRSIERKRNALGEHVALLFDERKTKLLLQSRTQTLLDFDEPRRHGGIISVEHHAPRR